MARVTLDTAEFEDPQFLAYLREKKILFRIVAYGQMDSVEYEAPRDVLSSMMVEWWDATTRDDQDAYGPIVD